MWGDSRAKLDYAELACKPYSMHPKKNVFQKKKLFERNGESINSKQIFTSLCLSWIVLEKKKEIVFFFPCFYCDLWYSLWKTKTHSLSIAWPSFEQSKLEAKEVVQESSHKKIVLEKTTQSHQASAQRQRIKFEIFWKYCDSIKTWC